MLKYKGFYILFINKYITYHCHKNLNNHNGELHGYKLGRLTLQHKTNTFRSLLHTKIFSHAYAFAKNAHLCFYLYALLIEKRNISDKRLGYNGQNSCVHYKRSLLYLFWAVTIYRYMVVTNFINKMFVPLSQNCVW